MESLLASAQSVWLAGAVLPMQLLSPWVCSLVSCMTLKPLCQHCICKGEDRCRYVDEGTSTCAYLQALAHESQQVQHALDGHVAEASSIGTARKVFPPVHMQQLFSLFDTQPCHALSSTNAYKM